MCLEDVRLGRASGSTQEVKTVTTTTIVLLDADDKRTAFVIGAPNAGVLTLSFADPAVSGIGIRINALASPLILDIQHHGQMVTRKISAIMSAGSETIGIWTSRLNES